MKEIIIEPQNAGTRLDKIVFRYLDKAPKSFVYKMLRKKNIVLNDKKASGSEMLKDGDVIKLYLADETILKFRGESKPHSSRFSMEEIRNLICYEDENLIAFQKPQGMLSQRSVSTDFSLNDLLLAYLQDETTDLFTPGISNRLDRNTSGLVLAGKNRKASRCLNEILKEKWISKHYLCLVEGVLEKTEEVDAFLWKDERNNQVKVTAKDQPGAKKIITRYEPLCHNDHMTLLDVDLLTGKSHQIRAHLAYLSHPLAGDKKYGDSAFNRYFAEKYGLHYQLLHAYRIKFHDIQNELSYLNGLEIEAGIPSEFERIIKGEQLWLPGTAEV